MIKQTKYVVMGDDGKEYGPVSAEQIRQWIAENRLERKTPVMPDHAKDWLFLEMLPEFSDSLAAIARAEGARRRSRRWMVGVGLIVLVALALFLLKQHIQ